MNHGIAPVYKRVNLAIAKGKWQRVAGGASAEEGTAPAERVPHTLCGLAHASAEASSPSGCSTEDTEGQGERKAKDGALLHLLSL